MTVRFYATSRRCCSKTVEVSFTSEELATMVPGKFEDQVMERAASVAHDCSRRSR